MRLTNSSAAAYVDRIEADSKFFRSLVVMLVVTLPALLALLSKEKVSLFLWGFWVLIISILVLWSRFKHQGVADRGGVIDRQIKEQLNDLAKDRLGWPDEEWFKIEARVPRKKRSIAQLRPARSRQFGRALCCWFPCLLLCCGVDHGLSDLQLERPIRRFCHLFLYVS